VEIDAITPALLHDTLRAWRQADEAPAGLLDLDILYDATLASRLEREYRLRELIQAIVLRELAGHRRAMEVGDAAPEHNPAGVLAALGRDFAAGSLELEAWSALYHRYLVPVQVSVEELAAAVPTDPRHFRRRVNAGIKRLAELLHRLEMAEHRRQRRGRLARHLPPAEYAALFGIDDLRRTLAGLIGRTDGPDFVSIEGIGGIGKTALVRAVAFELAEAADLDGIAWISARQTWLNEAGAIEAVPDAATSLADIVGRLAAQLGFSELAGLDAAEKLNRLTPFLKRSRHLIVIDNLESIDDVAALLPALSPLAGPTRFLLTSRQSMSRYPFVTRFAVPPLSLEDSRALVESELSRNGRLALLTDSDMNELFAIIGGMPLALKLVAAQMNRWPLPVLLDNLRQARLSAPESLYTFIYRHTWLVLNDPARHLLLSMLAVAPDGESVDWLRLVSILPAELFDEALSQLLAYSMLEVAGSLDSPRYRLHRLTTTFLQTEILTGWSNMKDEGMDA
jgi:hypothetical protein